jgi:hypothetical protein
MKIDNKTYIFRYKSKIGQEEVFHSFLDIQQALAFAENVWRTSKKDYEYFEVIVPLDGYCNYKNYAIVKDFIRSKSTIRSCTSLKKEESVVFLIYSDICKHKIPIDGSVIFVNRDRRKVEVIYLLGYKCEYDFIDYEDMLGVFNPDGVWIEFDNIQGRSDILVD